MNTHNVNIQKPISIGLYINIALLSWVAYSGVFSLPLWIGAVSDSIDNAKDYVGYIASIQLAFAAIAAIGVSLYGSKIKIKQALIMATILLIIANILSAKSTSIQLLIGARVLSGLAEGALLALLNGFISRTPQADKLFALSQTMVAVFGIVIFAVVPNLSSVFGSATTFYFVALVGLIALLFIVTNLPTIESESTQETVAKTSWTGSNLIPLLVLAILFIGLQAGWAFLERMGSAKGYSLQAMGNVLIIGQIIGLLSPALAIWLSGRIGRLKSIAFGVGVSAVAVACASQPLPDQFFVISAVFFQSGTLITVTAMLGYLAAIDTSGKAASAAPAAINIGSVFGPGLAGAVLVSYGFQGVGWLIFTVYGLGLLVLLHPSVIKQTES